jgi:hypothetical protein
MTSMFDIKDRNTWAWIDGGRVTSAWLRDGSTFVLNPIDRHSFYQHTQDGHMSLHQCTMVDGVNQQVFNPMLNVSDWPQNVTEEQVYDWAVSKGLVVDQRTKR